MEKITITEDLVRKTIVELAHYLQLQRGIEQQIKLMIKYEINIEEDMKVEEVWERTRARMELEAGLSVIKQLSVKKEDKLEELFEKVFSEEELGIKIFKRQEAYENAKWLWDMGEFLEDLHEDIMNTSSERLESVTLILQSLAGYKPWDLGVSEEKDRRISFLIGPKTWKNDMQRKAEWYKQRAKNGDANAQYMLGHMYYYGIGMEQNYVEATKQWRRASKQGHAAAKCHLGKCYAQTEGIIKGVKPDNNKAIELWNEAAYLGNKKAQYLLEKLERTTDNNLKEVGENSVIKEMADMEYKVAKMFENGEFGEKDLQMALAGYRRAKALGSKDALNRIMEGADGICQNNLE